MKIKGRIVVVTGGADGIGKGLCERFAAEGAKKIVVLDRNGAGAKAVADSVDGVAYECDVSREDQIKRIVDEVEKTVGPISIFVSNAGIGDFGGRQDDATSQPNEQWQRGWDVNVMAHVYAARACLPYMIARGEGYFVNTASAAGLLNQIGNACYGVTKHAAVGFAEWLSVTYGARGIDVHAICPQGVRTAMLESAGPLKDLLSRDGALEPEDVADAAMTAIEEGRFLVLPHPEIGTYYVARATDTDRWLAGMQRLQTKLDESGAFG